MVPPSEKGNGRRHDVAAIALVCGVTLLFFWRLIAPTSDDRLAFPRGDFTEQYYPLRHFVAATLADGQLPFWNPYIYGGQPGLADPQAATFYPPALLNMLAWGADFSLAALELEAVLHIVWAMVGAYCFIRYALRLDPFPALFGAVVWGFGGYLTGFPLQQVTILETLSWLPWVLVGVHGTIHATTPYRRRLSAALGAVTVGCAALAGHPQSLLYVLYTSVAYGIFLLVQAYGRNWRDWLKNGWRFVPLFGLGIGLAALQLLPTLNFIRESTRESLTYDFVQSGQVWSELLEVVLPKVVGATPLYFGIITLIVAVIGLLAPTQRAAKLFWGIVALVSVLVSLGGNSFFFDMLYLGLPGFSSVRSQERVLILWGWGVSVLAAWGAAALLSYTATEDGRARIRAYSQGIGRFIPILLLPLIVLWWLRAFDFSQVTVNVEVLLSFFDRYAFLTVMVLLGWVVLWWAGRTESAKPWLLGALLLALVTFDLFSINRAPHLGSRYENTLAGENEVTDALYARPADAQGRVAVVNSGIPQGNDGMRWGFEMLTGNEPLRIENTNNFLDNASPLRQFQLFGVSDVVADINLEEQDAATYEHIAASSHGAASHLHRLREAHPLVWFVSGVEQVEGRRALYERINAPDFNPYQTIIIDKEIAALAPDAATAVVGASLTIEERRAGYVRVRTNHAANGTLLLVFAEPSMNGWVALVDGNPVRRERVNALNIAVAVPSGEHVVTLEYQQPGWREGLLVSGASALGVVLLTLSLPRRRVAHG